MLKNTFFEWTHKKNSKILNGLKFNCFISISFTTKQFNKKFDP